MTKAEMAERLRGLEPAGRRRWHLAKREGLLLALDEGGRDAQVGKAMLAVLQDMAKIERVYEGVDASEASEEAVPLSELANVVSWFG
jgi:hypothetical protein